MARFQDRPSTKPLDGVRTFLILVTLPIVAAQGPGTTAASTSPTPDPTNPQMPSTSDNAPGSDSDPNDQTHSDSLVNYYFVFLALIICIAGLAAFMLYKRKRKMGTVLRNSRENALARDLDAWNPMRSGRRYWHGSRRSAEMSREEGLDEHGEAPPPYIPKNSDEEASSGPEQHATTTVPLRAVSREQAGLKPPAYAETDVRPTHEPRRGSPAAVSGSAQPAWAGV